MQITPRPLSTPRLPARPAAVAPAAQPAPVRAQDGPPPEYSLWAMLKDIGSRIASTIRGWFGRD